MTDPLLDEAAAIGDALAALVGVADEGLHGLADVFRSVETIKGRDGDPGPPGPPGESVKGDPGPPGSDAPIVNRIVPTYEHSRLASAELIAEDGSRRRLEFRRDATGRVSEVVRVR